MQRWQVPQIDSLEVKVQELMAFDCDEEYRMTFTCKCGNILSYPSFWSPEYQEYPCDNINYNPFFTHHAKCYAQELLEWRQELLIMVKNLELALSIHRPHYTLGELLAQYGTNNPNAELTVDEDAREQ